MSKEHNALEEAFRHIEEANEEIKRKSGRDLIPAILIGLAIGLSIVFAITYADWTMVIIAGIGGAFAFIEYSRALTQVGIRVPMIAGSLLSTALTVAGYFLEIKWLVLAWLAAVVLVALLTVIQHRIIERNQQWELWKGVIAGVFLVSYIGFCLALAMNLTSQDSGGWWLLACIIVVVSVDTGAYAFGITRGKTPFAPKISPKKTWEGFLGGAVLAIVAGILLSIFMLGMPWWFGIIFATVMIVVATVGDLSESLFKRQIGVKDMSSWLPGHGGFADRLDSILPSTASAWVIFQLVF